LSAGENVTNIQLLDGPHTLGRPTPIASRFSRKQSTLQL